MANYNRTILSNIWGVKKFSDLSTQEKLFYLYLHTSDITSDAGAYPLVPKKCAIDLNMSVAQIKKMLEKFEQIGYVCFDAEAEEICILDYHHEPKAGIKFEMFYKDLRRLTSQKVIDALVEMSKAAREISRVYFLALQQIAPEVNEAEFRIGKTSKTDTSNGSLKRNS